MKSRFFLCWIFICILLPLASQAQNDAQSTLQYIEYSLDAHTEQLNSSKEAIDDIEARLAPLQEQKQTLETQLAIFDQQLLLSQAKINNIKILKIQIERNIISLEEQNTITEIQLEHQKQSIADLMTFLLHNSQLKPYEQRFLQDVILQNSAAFINIGKEQQTLQEQQTALKKEQYILAGLQTQLEEETKTLAVQKQAKSELLSITQGREETYQTLLAENKKQMQEAETAVENLAANKQLIESRILAFETAAGLDSKNEQQAVLQEALKNLDFNLDELTDDIVLQTPLMWPVNPKKGISAGFLDNEYAEFFGTPHYAIDIPTPQGTPLYAPASGYVQKVADNGMGYSYILLGHKDGLSTLFGHVSQIDIEEGELIQMGQQIGLSGGTPGTKGAGLMTTGAHLHFEVHKDGKKVNPIDFLPKGFY